MDPPIFVYEPGDLSVFTSVEEAASYIECIDVLNHEYEAYDSLGRVLELQCPDGEYGRVTITPGEQLPTHEGRLRELIASTFQRTGGPDCSGKAVPLATLVDDFA